MITQQLIEYIRQRAGSGVSRENLSKELLDVGWSSNDLDKVFSIPGTFPKPGAVNNTPPPVQETQTNESPESQLGISAQGADAKGDVLVETETAPAQQTVNPSAVPSYTVSPPLIHDSFWYRPVIIITVLIILMGIAGGGVYAYYVYTKQPSAVLLLRGVMEKSAQIQSFDITATSTSYTSMNIASSSLSSQAIKVLGSTKLLYSTSTVTDSGTLSYNKSVKWPTFDMVTMSKGSVSIATTTVDYSMKLHSILSSSALDLNLLKGNISIGSKDPQLLMGMAFVNAALAKVSNKWVRVVDFTNASSTAQVSKLFSSLSASTSPAVSKDIKELRAYADSMQYVRAARNDGVEYLNGVPTYHLELTIQNTPKSVLLVQRFLYDYAESIRPSSGVTTDNITFAKFLQDTNGLNETLTQKIPINIWIGKKDSYVYKLTIPSITFIETNKVKKSRVTMKEEFSFANYNATKPIVSPQNAESLKTFISKIFGFGGGL